MASHRTTILQIIPALDTGGAELSTVEIAAAVVAAGGRAIVATTGGRLSPRIIEVGGEIVPFPAATKNPVRIMSNARALAALIRAEHVDLVHARSRAPAWSALSAARATRRPFVTTYHGAYNETGPLKRAYNSVMARGDLVIANSRYTADLIRSRYGTAEAKLRIIHRGVDPAVFAAATLPPERIAHLGASWGIGPGTPVVLQAARLTRWKGQSVLIDAFARLVRGGLAGEARLVLAGDDQGRTDYAGELRRQIDREGLSGRVLLVGHVDDMPAAFALARITVIASIEPEAFGRTSIEAQMMGCPVIATAIGAPPETVLAPPAVGAEQATGWLVGPGDAPALAGALEQALNLSAGAREAMSARARANAQTAFSLDAMKMATLAVYDELLDTGLASAYDRRAAS